jgi:thiamine biosynthesis lipoprotein
MRSASFAALGTSALVAVTEDAALPRARTMLEVALSRLDAACSRFRPDSELSRANECAGRTVEISPLLAELVAVGLRAYDASQGCVDPTLGSELRAAGYDRTFALVRERDTWTFRSRPRRDSPRHDVQLDPELGTLRVPAGVELDLGATAKAWCADRMAVLIARLTQTGVLVALGGDIAVAGAPPPTGWPVRIAADHDTPLDRPGPVVAIAEGGLATSSTSVRRWCTDRGEAHHILDPATGAPAPTPWQYVSVAATSCVDANVAATAAIVLGAAAPAWLEERALPARLVRLDGATVRTAGWPDERRNAA